LFSKMHCATRVFACVALIIVAVWSTEVVNELQCDIIPTEIVTKPHSDGGMQVEYGNSTFLVKGNHKIFQKLDTLVQEVPVQDQRPSFPSVSVDIPWGLPVEVQLIGTLPKGMGTLMYSMVTKTQSFHPEYILAFNEGSAKIMNTNFELDDPTAVYTFSVDKEDLVFHRHEGHRCITGIAGSGGALMKFSSVDHISAKEDPQSFIDKMFIVEIPADSIFVLRFNGMVYHQFGPKDPAHPAFWAVSVHTNEKGGFLTSELLEKVLNNEGNIPLLTEPIPEAVDELLKDPKVVSQVRRIPLSFDI